MVCLPLRFYDRRGTPFFRACARAVREIRAHFRAFGHGKGIVFVMGAVWDPAEAFICAGHNPLPMSACSRKRGCFPDLPGAGAEKG